MHAHRGVWTSLLTKEEHGAGWRYKEASQKDSKHIQVYAEAHLESLGQEAGSDFTEQETHG